jgi:hypothetical protein
MTADHTFVNERLARTTGSRTSTAAVPPRHRHRGARKGLLGKGAVLLVTCTRRPHLAGGAGQVDPR